MRHELASLLCCPACRGALASADSTRDAELRCASCGALYPVRDGIPMLLPPETSQAHIHDEIEHSHAHKRGQAAFFDRGTAEEFEITRPHGAPDAYRWLLARKFRRSVAHLPSLRGRTVAVGCCGSGMDAEMLCRLGARVIAIDISEGCARRALERARRRNLDYLVVVGDAERLPLRDRSVDIAYVHDGLHHLDDPADGIRELGRVARAAVSVNEPARAFGTDVAVRLGVALEREDAGNVVARLDRQSVSSVLASGGFDRVVSSRYLMYYKHEPGAVMSVASRPVLAPAYRGAVAISDALIGRWGNKLNVTALRRRA